MTYSRFLLENFMKYQVKEFVNEKYSKAINILKDNLKENYHIFYGVRLSEILFPASEYGTDAFFKEFESINSITLPLIIFEMNERKPVAIIGFEQIAGAVFVEQLDIKVLVIDDLSELLTNETLASLYN
ncbi:DNA distortion polypeptide 3 [Shigella flexneri]|uniref:DNA distortion polypeptide 3 n=5 Tax=Gammaproteobacteria TaxID=1236 RepID=A0AAP1RC72_ECOLX|nr:DNA distortion polypeptide 3 [Escherichia coli]EHM1385459.1 DNA distortion polypeptide 3 [Salmonella enterica]EHN7987459.1 DNA distortion polypeptide 3 [Salmonella enterica subsp. enterica serovar Typhimurium]EHT8751960.1 DNA distortion polypeptide 3 [Shigella sonnei]EHU6863448.1 DNA distortion polypeptide 3 [Shigella flexneri]EJF7775476.1 DNA distortion polypeptide 3 [Salmonella enterica subsp. enterica]EKW9029100.1 DNA distortion polypeptide 3 [Enterobacter hormaechei]EKZ1449181.1 DNA d